MHDSEQKALAGRELEMGQNCQVVFQQVNNMSKQHTLTRAHNASLSPQRTSS